MSVRASVQMTLKADEVYEEVLENTNEGINQALLVFKDDAVQKSPLDEGNLVGAHAVEPSTDPSVGGKLVVDTPYAARLHEHPEYNFSTDSNPNAQGKWVETTATENKTKYGDIIRSKARGS